MLTLGFWNVARNDNAALLAELARQLSGSSNDDVLLGFSEGRAVNDGALKVLLGSSWSIRRSKSSRFGVVTNLPSTSFKFLPEREGCLPIAVDRVVNGNPTTTLAWLVHLSPPIGEPKGETLQATAAASLHREVVALEKKQGTPRTVLIGDFNVEPYAAAMTAIDCLNAVMCKRIAGKSHRQKNKIKRRYFYNPMWNLLGDQTKTRQPASYYWSSKSGALWHAIDQVLLRAEVIDEIAGSGPEVIARIGSKSLLSPQAWQVDRKISDHLPISISLDL